MRSFHALAVFAILPAAAAQVQTLDPLVVSVTRGGQPRSEVPFAVEAVHGSAFSNHSSLTVDDVLRRSAAFSLFRRNDSMTANPTAQGVSLRGLGPSGTSRSLVLLDGVPLNDPFGGWVPWSAVPVGSIARAEIVPGSGATAWGNAALGGVIQLFSAEPAAGSGNAVAGAGGFDTTSVDVAQAASAAGGTLELRGDTFATDGTVLVEPRRRGPVDIAAASRHTVGVARWRGPVGRGTDAVVTLRRFEEWRDNGTAYQQNRLLLLFGSIALSGKLGSLESWTLTGYLQGQRSSQTFSSVSADRMTETPASDQFEVPATAVGVAGSSTWTDSTGGATTAGVDVRDVRGETRENFLYTKGAYTDRRFAGGRQDFVGTFVERSQPLAPGVHALAGLRVDRWEESGGHMRTSALAGGAPLLDTVYPSRAKNEVSPSGGLAWQATPALRFHVNGQRAFRQPTLNELYRPFRQGSTTTLANAALSTEHAETGEVGATYTCEHLVLTLEGFVARLDNAVANVTLAKGPGTFPLFGKLAAGAIGQERLNLDRVRTRGLQFGADWADADTWGLTLSGIAEEATIASASVAPALVGRFLPEVPRWTASLGVHWQPEKGAFLELRVRSTASQFDDDQNQLRLAAVTVVDASARVLLSNRAQLFVSATNLGDARIETAHSALGVFNLAPSRMVRGGAEIDW